LTEELGWTEATITRPRGVYEHFCPEYLQGTCDFGTHNIVLA
jgi:hypothetical protein